MNDQRQISHQESENMTRPVNEDITRYLDDDVDIIDLDESRREVKPTTWHIH